MQSNTSSLEGGEVAPAGHAAQVLLLDAPTAPENVPPAQFTQASDPLVSLYFPASHARQTPPSGPEYPALHEQMLLPPPAVFECACAGHALHVDSDVPPVSLLYLPVGQIEHATDPLTLL